MAIFSPQSAALVTGVAGRTEWHTASTDSSGTATWTFAAPYAAAPAVSLAVLNASGFPCIAEITALSASAVTIRVRRARTLPNPLTLLSELLGFDIWGGTDHASITVYMMANGP